MGKPQIKCRNWRWNCHGISRGASVKDMAFIQFHPMLAIENGRPFLITENFRGEGGVILDKQGLENWQSDCKQSLTNGIEPPKPENYSFTLEFSSLGSMATDIVAGY